MKKLLKAKWIPSLILVVLFMIWNGFNTKGFFTAFSFRYFLNIMVPLACIAIGVTVTVTCGGIDLSTGALVCVINCSYIVMLGKGMPTAAAMMICMLIAVAVGAVNGFFVAVVRINPMLVTYAMQTICTGLALYILPIAGGSGDSSFNSWYASGTILGVPNSVIFFILVPLVIWYVIKKTPMGHWLYATGKDERKAFESGINTVAVQMFAYIFSSVMTGWAALGFSGNIVGGDPKAGLSFTMNAIAATVVGGAALSGGEGDALGGVTGALFVELAIYAVLGAKVSTYVEELSNGLIVLLGVVGMMIYTLIHNKRRKAAEGRIAA